MGIVSDVCAYVKKGDLSLRINICEYIIELKNHSKKHCFM